MMKTSKFFIAKILIIVAMIVAGVFMYDKLPEQMPTHRNYLGQPDDYGPKLFALMIGPVVNIIFLMLFPILSRISPKYQKSALSSKSWEIMQISIMLFLAYIYFVSIYITLNPSFSINRFMFVGLGIFFAVLGNYMGKIRQNYFVGIKVPWTLANQEVWDKTNRLGGRTFAVGGILFVLAGIFDLQGVYVLRLLIAVIMLIVLLPMIYSLYIFKKLEKNS